MASSAASRRRPPQTPPNLRCLASVRGAANETHHAAQSRRHPTLRRESVAGDTYDRLKKIVVEQLGVEEDEVKPEASFVDDLNADSLDLVELIMSLEEEFGTEISDEDAEKIRTVQDAVDYIDERSS